MNRIFKAFAACTCTMLIASSCNDFLELYPRTSLVESEFYKTEDDMMKALYAVINETQTRLVEVWSYASLLSDESETGGGLGEGVWKTKWDTFQYNPDNCFGAYWCGGWWNEWDFGLYNGVTAANLLIDKLEQSTLSEGFVKPLQAEGKFYRALFYYYLWMGYEQCPLITKYLPVEEMYSIRKGTRQEIYEFMLSDLSDDVIKNLPDRKETVQGRVCKQAAQLLKAKIILFHRDESKYAEALADLKGIINSRQFELYPDFRKIWLKEGEWCSESVFDVCFAGNNSGEGNGLGRSLGGRNISDPRSAEQGGLMEGWGQCTMPSTIYNIFKPGDTRREGTVIVYSEEEQKVLDLVASGALEAGSAFHVSDQQENYEGLGTTSTILARKPIQQVTLSTTTPSHGDCSAMLTCFFLQQNLKPEWAQFLPMVRLGSTRSETVLSRTLSTESTLRERASRRFSTSSSRRGSMSLPMKCRDGLTSCALTRAQISFHQRVGQKSIDISLLTILKLHTPMEL